MNPQRKALMLLAFTKFRLRIADRYAEAQKCLEDGNYVEAERILAQLSISHAKTALSLRALLLRNGHLTEENL